MANEQSIADDPRIGAALAELSGIIKSHYPEAEIVVTRGYDPEGFYLKPIVDVDDTEEIFDTVIDRLLQMQIDEGLPIYVVPVRPPSRVAQILREQSRPSQWNPGHATVGP